MNPELIAIFDQGAHMRATLAWKGSFFAMESVPGFKNDDIEKFLSRLSTHDPRQKKEHAAHSVSVPKTNADYRNAVWQELGMQGFITYPIEEYQKNLLLILNDERFDKIQENVLGDLLTIPEKEIISFMEDLKEGMKTIKELQELE